MADLPNDLKGALDRVLDVLRTARSVDELSQPFDELVDSLLTWCRKAPHAVYMQGVDGAPDWTVCEFRAWEMGEAVRKASSAARPRRLLRDAPETVERFVGLQALGKGRGSWTTTAIAVGGAESAERLALGHLDDPDVNGEILKGLTRWRVPGFEEPATRLTIDARSRFARSQAKRYLRVDFSRR